MTGRTIVYLPNWLGDMVMAVPFLHALRSYVHGEIWCVGKPDAIHIYNGLELFDRFLPYDGKGVVSFFEIVGTLKGTDFKRSIVLPHSFRSALLFYNLRIKERIGYSKNGRGFMLTTKITEAHEPEPTVEHYLKIIDALGCKRSLDVPVLMVTEDEERRFDEVYTDMDKAYGVFIVDAHYGPSKCWPVEHFSTLADMITEKYGIKIYMVPAKDGEEVALKVKEGAKNKDCMEIKLFDMRDLKVCLSLASFVVSNDTGPRHISAALSIPTIVLLGPMDKRYTAYPSPYIYTIEKEISCRPCNKKACDRGHECLRGIEPKEVFKMVEEILEDKR